VNDSFNIVHTVDKHKHFRSRVGIGTRNRKQRSRVVSEDKLSSNTGIVTPEARHALGTNMSPPRQKGRRKLN